MSDRGIKKWAPYKSLVEQEPNLNETVDSLNRKEKPIMSEDVAEKINEILVSYHKQELKITYYRNKKILQIVDKIKKIDVNERKLLLADFGTIYFDELINLDEYSR